MTVELPSGHAAPSMTSLDRVTRLAYEHGYRVGLQIGEHGIVAAHVRDIEGEQKMIAVLGRTIEEASVELLGVSSRLVTSRGMSKTGAK
jgi:hypothetical protein